MKALYKKHFDESATDYWRWVAQFQSPALLPEYVQEVGRGGRDGKRAEALTLVSECNGLLNPQAKQRQQFLRRQQQQLWQRAQRLMKKLPQEGEVQTISRQFKDGAIALSLLHKTGPIRMDRSVSLLNSQA